jgi:ATP-binding cassette subfamily B protein
VSAAGELHPDEQLGKIYDGRLLRRIWEYARPHQRLFWIAAALIAPLALLEVAQPYLVKLAIDQHIAPRRVDGLGAVALLYFAALLAKFAITFAQAYALMILGTRATTDLRRACFVHAQRMPLAYYDRTPLGRIITRMTSDTEAIAEMSASGAVLILSDAVTLASIVVAMIALDLKLALVTFALTPPFVIFARLLRGPARESFRVIRLWVARINSYLQENLAGSATVQLFVREPRNAQEFRRLNAAHRDANLAAIRYDSILYAAAELAASVCVAALIWYGAGGIVAGTVSFGVLVAFVQYVERFFGPIRDLSQKYTVMQYATASADRIFSFLDEAPPKETPLARAPAPLRDALQLRDVAFHYRADQPVLRGVDLLIRRGEKVAVVGATGAGKTTLARLVTRLYELDPGAGHTGAILWDGEDVRAFDLRALRRRMAMVLQDSYLFAGTVRENVAMGDALDDARIEDALRRVGAWPAVEKLGGLGGAIRERGSNLSHGERQLLAFARALSRDPDLLLLDEATSSVDPVTESALRRGVDELWKGRTSLVIAHRLSTVENADRIVVLHHGRVVEEGTHKELLRRGGAYARLYQLQFAQQAA